MGGEDLGQRVRQILQQMKAVGHLAGRGSAQARGFRIRLRPIPHEDLNPRMRLQPMRDSSSLAIGEQSQGPPLFKIQEEGAVGVVLPRREIIHAEDLWRGDRGAGGAADDPQQGVPADGKAERPA
jgi:hypothetical protein